MTGIIEVLRQKPVLMPHCTT